eukprot:COSAG01_NODE_8674_length_2701_cov_510.323982_2_plen_573_part_00
MQWTATRTVIADFCDDDVAKAAYHLCRGDGGAPQILQGRVSRGQRVVVVGAAGAGAVGRGTEGGGDASPSSTAVVAEWTRVRRVVESAAAGGSGGGGGAEGGGGAAPERLGTAEGLLPTCVLEPPCPAQGWELEIGPEPPSRSEPPTILRHTRPSADDAGQGGGGGGGSGSGSGGSLFALDSEAPFSSSSRPSLAMEFRPADDATAGGGSWEGPRATTTAAAGGSGGAAVGWTQPVEWQAVVRGLSAATRYRLRVRSVLATAPSAGPAGGADRACHGEWSHPILITTARDAPSESEWWDHAEEEEASSVAVSLPWARDGSGMVGGGGGGGGGQQQLLVEGRGQRLELGDGGWMAKKLRCSLQRRWVRVRPAAHWDMGMDVFWRLRSTKAPQSARRLLVFLEGAQGAVVRHDVLLLSRALALTSQVAGWPPGTQGRARTLAVAWLTARHSGCRMADSSPMVCGGAGCAQQRSRRQDRASQARRVQCDGGGWPAALRPGLRAPWGGAAPGVGGVRGRRRRGRGAAVATAPLRRAGVLLHGLRLRPLRGDGPGLGGTATHPAQRARALPPHRPAR